jgi:uncharacterized protein YndB with AHSA1/START domain
MTTNHFEADASAQAVYEVLLDPYAYADWVVGSKKVRSVDPGWPAPGSRFHHTVGTPGIDIEDSSKIIDLTPDERLVLEVRFRPLGIATVTLELQPIGDGHRTGITMTEVPKEGPVRKWWSFVLAGLTYGRNAIALRRLARMAAARSERVPRSARS